MGWQRIRRERDPKSVSGGGWRPGLGKCKFLEDGLNRRTASVSLADGAAAPWHTANGHDLVLGVAGRGRLPYRGRLACGGLSTATATSANHRFGC